MSADVNNNGKNWKSNLQTILLIITIIFLFVDRFVIAEKNMNALTERIAKLEGVVSEIGLFPNDLSTIRADIAALKVTAERNRSTLERLDQNLTDHITKGK